LKLKKTLLKNISRNCTDFLTNESCWFFVFYQIYHVLSNTYVNIIITKHYVFVIVYITPDDLNYLNVLYFSYGISPTNLYHHVKFTTDQSLYWFKIYYSNRQSYNIYIYRYIIYDRFARFTHYRRLYIILHIRFKRFYLLSVLKLSRTRFY
jgi:hypothetical protein